MKPTLSRTAQRVAGFTLIELVVVMAVIGLLLTLAMPRYLGSLERGQEHVLKNNLAQMREAIDRFYGDTGRYPERLDELVSRRYLRSVPLNPYTEAPDWVVIAPPQGGKGAVYDVRPPGPRAPTAADEPASAAADGDAAAPAPDAAVAERSAPNVKGQSL